MNQELIEPGNIFEIPTDEDGTYRIVFESHADVKIYDEDGEFGHVANITTFGEGDDINFMITLIGGGWIVI